MTPIADVEWVGAELGELFKLSDLTGGVLSSVVAVLAVEAWLRVRSRLSQRRMRKVLGFYGTPCNVITPVHEFPDTFFELMVEMGDVFAISQALVVCDRVKSVAALVPSNRPDGVTSSHVISIGGWSGNGVTRSLMDTYCPGFSVQGEDKEFSDFWSIYYQCGEHRFQDSENLSYGFIVKLSPEITGHVGTSLLVWGHGDLATSAGMYIVESCPRMLLRLRRDSFFVAFTVQKHLGFRSIANSLLDISDDAFRTVAPVKPSLST